MALTIPIRLANGTPEDADQVMVNFDYLALNAAPASIAVYAVPVSADTLTASQAQSGYQLEPAAALTSLTVIMPAAPVDQDEFWLSSTTTITGLVATCPVAQTMAAGSVGPITLGAGGRLTWKYLGTQNKWYGQF